MDRDRPPYRPKQPKKPKTLKPRVECPTCGKTYGTPRDLRRHKLNHVPKEQHKFKCCIGQCTYATSHDDRFKIHQNIHAGVKPYKCLDDPGKCNFATVDPSSLHLHRRRLHNYKPTPRKRQATPEASSSAEGGSPSTSSSPSEHDIVSEQFQFGNADTDARCAIPRETELSSYFDPAGPSELPIDNALPLPTQDNLVYGEFSSLSLSQPHYSPFLDMPNDAGMYADNWAGPGL